MDIDKNKPVYSTTVTADLSGISKSTLIRYEKAGLITPHKTKKGKRNGQRLYSNTDIEWLICIRDLIKQGYSIISLTKLLKYESCYQLKGCSKEVIQNCNAVKKRLSKE
jgi:MerR family transcriptional regulator, heat shock protein HspR